MYQFDICIDRRIDLGQATPRHGQKTSARPVGAAPRPRDASRLCSPTCSGGNLMVAESDSDLDTLVQAASAYDARHRRLDGLSWPDGVRIAVNFTADFDAMLLRRLLNEPPMQLAKG